MFLIIQCESKVNSLHMTREKKANEVIVICSICQRKLLEMICTYDVILKEFFYEARKHFIQHFTLSYRRYKIFRIPVKKATENNDIK